MVNPKIKSVFQYPSDFDMLWRHFMSWRHFILFDQIGGKYKKSMSSNVIGL